MSILRILDVCVYPARCGAPFDNTVDSIENKKPLTALRAGTAISAWRSENTAERLGRISRRNVVPRGLSVPIIPTG